VEQVEETAISIPIGRPISNTQIYVLDGNLQPVPVGVPGELHVGGDGLARGYLNRPDLTQEKFVPDPFSFDPLARLYKTGDLVRYSIDGSIEYIGRIDNQVKIRGFRIELGEIETALLTHPAVSQAIAIAREDELGKKQLIAYVVCHASQSATISELRQFLKDRLPEYMQPAAIVILENFALTPNGKIDRRALPAPDLTQQLEEEYVAPRDEIEQTLAQIWTEVLGIPRVGIRDNFFELGGDSILSLQIVARANQAGLQLTPKQLFGNQTIAELAAVAGTAKQIQAEQGLVTGSVPLTPIQHCFFEQNSLELHHYNQSVMLSVPADLIAEQLERVLQHLVEHHDALRLRFARAENAWEQHNANSDESVHLQVIDLAAMLPEAQLDELERFGSEQQARLNLSDGPLMRAVLFRLGSDKPARLLLIIHHLAVDGVSWRILLEDLSAAYQQLERGETICLPAKTTSFKQWSLRLAEHGCSDAIAAELDYWLTDAAAIAIPLPVDYPANPEANTFGNAARVSVELSEEQTRTLLQDVPAVYHTQINDVLLTALAQSFARWTGERSLYVSLEGHGREDLFEDLDVSRTVGWFTSIFPIRLQLTDDDRPDSALKSIKEQLRRIPNRGIGYSILCYLSGKGDRLKVLPQPEVSFNYLGQFDRELSTSLGWEFDRASGGAEQPDRLHRSHLLDVNGLVVNGKLQISWIYCERIHQYSTIERLAQWFLDALQQLIEHCQSPDAGGFTPSDFPEAELSQEEIDEIMLGFIFSEDELS
jgi:non-ribosomal peptide synthase protein (TIGR01720 family)